MFCNILKRLSLLFDHNFPKGFLRKIIEQILIRINYDTSEYINWEFTSGLYARKTRFDVTPDVGFLLVVNIKSGKNRR